MHIKIDKCGRFVLPKMLRTYFNIRAGAELEVEERGGKIILSLVNAEMPLVEEEGVLVFTGRSLDNLDDALESFRDERLDNLGRIL